MLPFKFDTKKQQASEKINDYFIRTKGILEVKTISERPYPLPDITRYVFKTGVIYEILYNADENQDYTLLLPDITLVEAFHFLNTAYNLEMEERGGKSDNIRLINLEEDRLFFTNTYLYSGVEGKKRKIYTIKKTFDFVAISIEEVEMD